jgi:hypothetical protein
VPACVICGADADGQTLLEVIAHSGRMASAPPPERGEDD